VIASAGAKSNRPEASAESERTHIVIEEQKMKTGTDQEGKNQVLIESAVAAFEGLCRGDDHGATAAARNTSSRPCTW